MRGLRVVSIALGIAAVAILFLGVSTTEPSGPSVAERHTAIRQVPVLRPDAPVAVAVPRGRPLAVMRVPRFGAQWEWAVRQGVDASTLALGPGHYPQTPLPGALGNVAIAAHRAGHGDPFIDFDLLRRGDLVYLSQGRARWVYRIQAPARIISPDAIWVLNRFAPGRWLTLTTCWPKYGSAKRMYVRAALVRSRRA